MSTSPPNAASPLALGLYLSGLLGLVGFLAFSNLSDGVPTLAALAIVQTFPFFLDLILRRASLLSYVLLIHFMYTCFGKIIDFISADFTPRFTEKTLAGLSEQLTCSLIIVTIYFLAEGIFRRKPAEMPKRPSHLLVSPNACLVNLVFFAMIPWSGALLSNFGAVSSFFTALSIIFANTTQPIGYEKKFSKLLPFLGLYLLVDYLMSGITGNLALFALLYIIAESTQGKWSALTYAGIMAVIFFGIQFTKSPLRAALNTEPGVPKPTMSEKLSIVSEAFEAAFSGSLVYSDLETLDMDLDTELDPESPTKLLEAKGRLDEETLATVLEATPSRVPFFYGETYEQILYIAIPRFLWRDKPTMFSGNRFGKLYNIISEDNDSTSISVPLLAEGYMNFGYVGLYLTAVFIGLFVFSLERAHVAAFNGNYLLSFVCAFAPFTRYENPLGPLIYVTVAMGGLLYILRLILINSISRKPASAI